MEERTGPTAAPEIMPRRAEVSINPIVDRGNAITSRIIGCAIEVHRTLGPGLLEKLYEAALVHELRMQGLRVEQQKPIRMRYKDIALPEQVMDLLVEDLVIVELKSVENVAPVHLATLVSYLGAAALPLGLLINFNVSLLMDGIHRRINSQAVDHATGDLENP